MISVGFQRRVKNDSNEPRREVKSKGVDVPVPYLNCLIRISRDDMLVKADASSSVEENRVKDCQSEITNDYITG